MLRLRSQLAVLVGRKVQDPPPGTGRARPHASRLGGAERFASPRLLAFLFWVGGGEAAGRGRVAPSVVSGHVQYREEKSDGTLQARWCQVKFARAIAEHLLAHMAGLVRLKSGRRGH